MQTEVKTPRIENKEIIDSLNLLLSDYQIYYQNLRGMHWNIRGRNFFELHMKFEEYYLAAQDRIDEIAERILMIGGRPFHSFQDYLSHSRIPVGTGITSEVESMDLIRTSLDLLLDRENELLELSGSYDDEGTNALMSDLISEHEKMRWMVNAWLG